MNNVAYCGKFAVDTERPNEAFGAPNLEEYQKWSPHVCGICCLKMVGDTFGPTRGTSLYALTVSGLELGVFRQKGDMILGAFHAPLLRLAESTGLSGRLEKHLTTDRIVQLLGAGKFVLLSVDKAKIDPTQSGGHLILIHGWNKKDERFTVHDPDPILDKDGRNVQISPEDLRRISNQRGMSLWYVPGRHERSHNPWGRIIGTLRRKSV